MIRKLLMVAAAAAIPIGAMSLGAGVANAGKGPPPASPPLTCSASGSVTFAAPGITNQGFASASKDSTTNTSGLVLSGAGCGGGGSALPHVITSKSAVKCSKTQNGVPAPTCVPHDYVYDSSGQFVSAGVATIQKALKHNNFSIVVNGVTVNFSGKTTSAAIATATQCPSEVGFVLTGTVKAKPYTYSTSTLVACLGTDTDSGVGATGTFAGDIVAEIGGNTTITIAAAVIDPAHSTLSVS